MFEAYRVIHMGLHGVELQDWLLESKIDLVEIAAAAVDLLADECRVGATDNAERLVDLSAIEHRLQVASIRAVSAFDVAGDYLDFGAGSVQRYLANWCRFTGPEASARRRCAQMWLKYDLTANTLTHNEITAAHLAVLAKAADKGRDVLYADSETELIDIARNAKSFPVFVRAVDAWIAAADDLLDQGGPDQRYLRRHLQLSTTLAGMLLVRGRLSEEQRDIVLEAFEHVVRQQRNTEPDPTSTARDEQPEPRTSGQIMADALVEMCQRFLADENAGTRPAHGATAMVDIVISPAMVAEWLAAHADDLPTEIIDLLHPANNTNAEPNGEPAGDAGGEAAGGPAGDTGDETTDSVDDSAGDASSESDRDHYGDDWTADPGVEEPDPPVHPDRKGRRRNNCGAGDLFGRDEPAAVTPLGLTGDELREIANHPTDRLGVLAAEILRSGPIHSATAALLACDAWIGVTIFNTGGEPLHHGRKRRLFSQAQRHALMLRDGGCVFPGCDRSLAWCDAHHLTPWNNGGETNIDGGALLCRHHHTCVHHGWQLTRHADGTWTAKAPPRKTREPQRFDLERFRHTLKRTRNHDTTNNRIADLTERLAQSRPPPQPQPQPVGDRTWPE